MLRNQEVLKCVGIKTQYSNYILIRLTLAKKPQHYNNEPCFLLDYV